MAIGGGKERDLRIMGVYPDYAQIRNLLVLSGRFFDKQDSQAHNKVGLIGPKLAIELYGSEQAALGKTVKLSGLPFTIIGIFRERVDTFEQSEVDRKCHADSLHCNPLFSGNANGETDFLLH